MGCAGVENKKIMMAEFYDVHYRIVFYAVPSEGPKVMAIQYWFSALSLAYRDIFFDSQNLLMIICTVDNEILYIEKHYS